MRQYVYLYACVLTRVAEIITATHIDLRSCMHPRPTDELDGSNRKTTQISLTSFTGFIDQLSSCFAVSCASQPMGFLLHILQNDQDSHVNCEIVSAHYSLSCLLPLAVMPPLLFPIFPPCSKFIFHNLDGTRESAVGFSFEWYKASNGFRSFLGQRLHTSQHSKFNISCSNCIISD